MATQSKGLLVAIRRNHSEGKRIASLATENGLLEAQRWFSKEKFWINEKHVEICRIAAPTFFERSRAEWLAQQFQLLGWHAELDRAGNVVARTEDGAIEEEVTEDAEESRQRDLIAVTAHLDTVLAPHAPTEIHYDPRGRLLGPGVSDNGAGLVALLALARVLRESPGLPALASGVVLVANVGEEGEGNLSGMRYFCKHSPLLDRIKAFVVLDGPSVDHITSQALASRRFDVLFTGPGGHSWNDHGAANPVHAISQAINLFTQAARQKVDLGARCSYNFGIIEGGTSINSIPASARAKLDLRSEDASLLDELSGSLSQTMERALEFENRTAKGGRLSAKIKELGSRPGGKLPESAPLLEAIRSVDAYLNIRSRVDCASTDANIPLSMGLSAISIGAGGQGGGAHTLQEWFHPEGRELGLRRILLLLAALQEPLSE